MNQGIKTHSVVLVSPPLTLEDRYGKDMKHFGAVTEPLGIAYLAGSLEEMGIQVAIIDAPALNLSIDETIDKISDYNYSLIGISLLTPSFGVVKQLCDKIKDRLTEKTIILGGPHCTAMPEQTLSEISSADIVCFGEGEETIKEVAFDTNPANLHKITGICFRSAQQKIITNKPRPFIKNLDQIPSPARHMLPKDKYHLTASRVAEDSYCPTLIVARGCPFGCSYCSHSFGRKIRFHSVERIIDEIKTLISEYHITQVNLEADTLTANKLFVKELCQALITEGISKQIKWTCESRVDTVDQELLEIMKLAGCWQISYGIETGSQRLLNMINKSISLEQVEETIALTHRTGISVRGFFMLGLPSETEQESMETINFAIKLNPRWAQFTITIPYPGTPMFAQLDQEGKIRHYDWSQYNTWSGWKKDAQIPFIAEGRSLESLVSLQKLALRKFYLRPKIFIQFILAIKNISDFKKYVTGFYVLLKSNFS